jgi:hypothetical protein
MLNLDDPRSEIIFKASSYIDRIKMSCTKFPLQEFEERQLTFLNMEILCEEFIEFIKVNYPEKEDNIIKTITEVQSEVEKLSNINIETEPGNCKVCNGRISHYDSLVKEFGIIYNCDTCSQNIYKFANDLEMYTGAWMI